MMHEIAAKALRERFVRAAHCATKPGADRAYFLRAADTVLDEYLAYRDYATEWDAAQWGFGDQWMAAERREIRKRAGGDRRVPVEAV